MREPLPADSPLWGLPNAVITPHAAVNVPAKLRRSVDHFAANLARFCAGEPLEGELRGEERGEFSRQAAETRRRFRD